MTCDTGAEAELLPRDDGTILWNEIEMSAHDGPLPCNANEQGGGQVCGASTTARSCC
jgi:hypothetical protein